MGDVISLDRLTAGYGEAVVLADISLKVAEGRSLALLGRNGMGKTTLINSIVGVTRYRGGTIRLAGRDITRLPPERRDILDAVAALPDDGTVLLIEHDMDIVFSFANRISVLVNGALFVEGPPEEVASDPRVKAVYLGEAADG